MRFLVAGGGGFIGFHAALEALSRGHGVLALCRRENHRTRALRGAGAAVVLADLLADVPEVEADVCIYAAGNARHGLSLSRPELDLQENAEAAVRFLREFGGAAVLVSSAAVYHGHRGHVDPSVPLHPTFPYAISKLAAEQYVQWLRSTGQLEWVTTVRLYYAYGPEESERRLVPRICAHVLEGGGRPFPVTAPEGSLIDPLYVKDVARALVTAAQGAAKDRVLDLCGGESQLVAQFVKRALLSLGGTEAVEAEPNPSEVPVLHRSSPDDAFRLLGLERRMPLGDGLRESFQWYRSVREGG